MNVDFLASAAGDPLASEALLRSVLDLATKSRSVMALNRLAANLAIPADVRDQLATSDLALVRRNLINRGDMPQDYIVALASDPRPSVASAVAATPGLPVEVYAAMLEAHQTSTVLSALLANPSVPMDLREPVVVKLAHLPAHAGTGYMRLRSRLVLEAGLLSVPHRIDELAATVVSFTTLGDIVSSEAATFHTSQIALNRVKELLPGVTVHKSDKGGRKVIFKAVIGSPVGVLHAAMRHTDNDWVLLAELCTQLDNLACNASLTRMLGETRKRARKRSTTPGALFPAADGGVINTLQASAGTLGERVRALLRYQTTDAQFTAMLTRDSDRYTYLGVPPKAPAAFTRDCHELARRSSACPARVAALLRSVGYHNLPAEVFSARFLPAVVGASMRIASTHGSHMPGTRDEWIKPVLDAGGLTDDLAQIVPAQCAWPRYRLMVDPHCDTQDLKSRWNAAVARYVFAKLGDDHPRWGVLAGLARTWEGSLAQLLEVTDDVVAQAA